MLIDLLSTFLVLAILGGVLMIVIVLNVRSKELGLKGYRSILTAMAIVLAYIIIDIIIKGGIHL